MSTKKQKYVVGFMFDEDDILLLIEKTKPDWQKGKLNGVGGKIEPGEQPIDAMVREFREETAIVSKAEQWELKIHLIGPEYEVYFFSARGKIAFHYQTTEERLQIVAPNKLPQNTIYNLRWMIPLVLDKSIQFPLTINDKRCEKDCTGTNK